MKRPKRKPIPLRTKKAVRFAQWSFCPECHKLMTETDEIEYDHRPPIILRQVNADGTDYIPPQLDPNHIEALHKRCHLKRTVGRKQDAEKTVTVKGSDIWLKTKFSRLENPRKKRKIPSRPFPKRSKHVQAKG